MKSVEVPQLQSSTEFGDEIEGSWAVFDAFCVIFRAPPVVPELSASFSSFRALTTVSARGLQGVPESPGV